MELKFESILNLLEIENEFQYEYMGKFFDFYIPNKNVLIEVDGDFYHCNPNSIHTEPKYETQKLTVNNDKIKDKLCRNNFTLFFRHNLSFILSLLTVNFCVSYFGSV